MRAPDGTITTFLPPGNGRPAINPTGINSSGTIVGAYFDMTANFYRGFVRSPSGKFTTINAPGAGTGSYQGTSVTGINDAGEITGYYLDANNVGHGFVQNASGALVEFQAFDSSTVAGPINGKGVVAGSYQSPGVTSTYLRGSAGGLISFAGPESIDTLPAAINRFGAVAGTFLDVGFSAHGFIRIPSGALIPFNVPGAGTGASQGTEPSAMNNNQVITGSYIDGNWMKHGFIRRASGTLTTFDVPGAAGTMPTTIDANGLIAGTYVDQNGETHGFTTTVE